MKSISPTRIKIAWLIAIAADFLQVVLVPLFTIAWPLNDALDVVICFMLTCLVGWHLAFLPTFLVKVVPAIEMVPCWTLAVFLATRQKSVPPPPIVTEVYAETVPQPQLKEPADSKM